MISVDRFRAARDRGCAYLLRQLRPDGGFGPEERGLADYYKVPSALQACGETRAAHRLCQWIRRHGMTPEGDFGPRPEETHGYYYAYYNTWVILGADRLGQYDLARRGMDFLMRFYDPLSGGFYSSPTERTAATLQDMWVVCGCGQAALCAGRMEAAQGVGRWLREVMRQQPDYPKQLYSVFSRERGLHTAPDPADDIRYVCSQDATRDQYFFHPGIAGGFLCRLHQATGEAGWLGLAREYMRFAEGASDHLFRLLRAGKVGWAASLLYTLTGEPKYRAMAVRVGDRLIETQSPDGSWVPGEKYQNDFTAELVVWLDEIYQAVGSA
jgi:hypothetical protein